MVGITSQQEAKTLLLKWMKDEERRGEEAVECAEVLLKTNPGALGDKVWDVYEYVAMAALDCCRPDLVKFCVEKLCTKFPNSIRATRLKGLILESEGKLEEAIDVYDALLMKDPNSMPVKKRLIALSKATGDYETAITDLVKYLDVFVTDYEAWAELCMLYLRDARYTPAAFCVEELILAHPTTDSYFVLYGEICYAQKKFDMARKYYGKAADLNNKNLKALYGVFM
eukprot:Ihof_evm6s273 gene=Ihof_evmTU6s273